MTHHNSSTANTDNPTVGHEERDVQIRPIVLLGLGLLALMLFGLAGVWLLDLGYRAAQPDALVLPTEATQIERLPPPPRLQAAPDLEIATYQAQQREELTTYGWIDRNQGTVRLPIEDAKALLLERGLPVREQ